MTYSLSVSLDGYIIGPDGSFDFGPTDEEVFELAKGHVRDLSAHVLGRKLYETMLYWENAEQDPELSPSRREFARLWNALPKVVFSRSLTTVRSNARLATADLNQEIARLRAEPGTGNIAIGGADLAHQAADLDLIDEYLVRIYPVLVGGGVPFFAQSERRVQLELVESQTFASGIVYLRYRVVRGS